MKEKIDLESKEFIDLYYLYFLYAEYPLWLILFYKYFEYFETNPIFICCWKFLSPFYSLNSFLFRQYPTLLENAESFFLYLAPFSEIPLFKFIDNLEKEFYVFYAIYLYKWLDKLSTLELNTPA